MSGDPLIDSMQREISALKSENIRLKDELMKISKSRDEVVKAHIRFIEVVMGVVND